MLPLLLVLSLFFSSSLSVDNRCSSVITGEDFFSVDPEDEMMAKGERVVFHCEYNTEAFWIWEFYQQNGRRLTIDSNDKFPYIQINMTNGDLIITMVATNHSGQYACRRSVASGCHVYSENATLIVTGRPDLVLTQELEDGGSSYCSNSTSSVEIRGLVQGYPMAAVQLYGVTTTVNSSRVAITQPTEQSNNFRIVVSDLRTTDEGTYQVMATNTEGSTTTNISIVVKGPDPPQLTIEGSPYVIQRYSTHVSVTCRVQSSANSNMGVANLTMRWMRQEEVMVANAGSTQLVLDLADFAEAERGEYICSASNVRGKASPKSIQVYAPIKLPTLPVLTMLEDGRYNISWVAPSPPSNVPIYQYVVYIRQDGSSVLTFRTNETYYVISPSSLSSLDPGSYVISVAVALGNSGGEGNMSTAVDKVTVPESEKKSVSMWVIIIAAVVAGMIIVVGLAIFSFFVCYYYPHRRKLNSQQQSWPSKEAQLNETDQPQSNGQSNPYEPLTLPPHAELPPSPAPHNGHPPQYYNLDIDPKWEFPRENLQLSEVLCESQFTVLYKGSARSSRTKPVDVAVKALKDNATENEVKFLCYEMEQLASLGSHSNIVSLQRVCTVGKPLYMVMEYMCHGDLLGFLRASRGHYSMYTVSPGLRNQQPQLCPQLSSRDLLSIGSKVANGMRFLADRKIVHRALCCKNILVGSGLNVKIYNIGGYDLPAEVSNPLFKWMAPEVLNENNFSTSSDVWAFGVTLWEMVTLGATPYTEFRADELYSQFCSGIRLQRPNHCAKEIYDVMVSCWAQNSSNRPHFATIHEQLENLSVLKMSLLDLSKYDDMEYSQFDEFPSQATAL